MFQDFSAAADPSQGVERVARVRSRMRALGVDAIVVPRSDEHMGEYVPPSSERLKWLTGFTGSAGVVIVGGTSAALFVDGRYTLQAGSQVDKATFEILQIPENEPADWIAAKVKKGGAVGFDPWLHTSAWVARVRQLLGQHGIRLKPLSRNPIDTVWGTERPAAPLGPVTVHPLKFAGKPAEQKITELQTTLKEAGEAAAVLTMPDSIAWVFNIRGSDVQHNPTPLAFAVLHATGKPELFVDKRKLSNDVRKYLNGISRLREPAELKERIDALKKAKKRVRIDDASAAFWFRQRLGATSKLISNATDPCVLPKARKNKAEIAGARAAHERDGVAMARFLAWLDREASSGQIDEVGAVTQLEALRAETQLLKEISFDTISGSGAHGAIVHYRVTAATNRKLKSGELFLVDSGAQYEDGTTDVTRTVAIGSPTQEMRERFTLVLKGHIAISTARFPKATAGAHLDAFARHALWQQGLDFDHGTGHGVGSYLSVHEGPQGLSKRSHVSLEPGMIVSNEPGYYKAGQYGIRIENLLIVTEAEAIPGGDRKMMGFETLTLVPIDLRLVEPKLLTADEITWLNAYHVRVREVIGPHLVADRKWLEAATVPLRI
ncbi:MAG: aminopeptidase P family protein [Hyphomicrobiaceae bacterium]